LLHHSFVCDLGLCSFLGFLEPQVERTFILLLLYRSN
jgi:hypothetical protein